MKGRLIVLEGTDGSGKSTQFERLCKKVGMSLAACRDAALEAADVYGWRLVSCLDDVGNLRSVDDIHEEIWAAVREFF